MVKVTFVENGNTMAFDERGQVAELQESWLMLYARHAESQGYDPTKFEYELPDGSGARLFKTEDGYSWRVL